VFSAVSQSLTSSGSFSPANKDAQLALSFALAESASELRRARTIQLLRDGLFTACLAYANGALNPQEFERLQNKYADATVTLLAIEQITPQEVSSPITLSSGQITNKAPSWDKGSNASDGGAEQASPPSAPASAADAASAPSSADPASAAAKSAKNDSKAKSKAKANKAGAPADKTSASAPANAASASGATDSQSYIAGAGNASSSLAPPTPYAVTAVDHMTTAFLNNTLINKCLDTDPNQSASKAPAAATASAAAASAAQLAIDRARIHNDFCDSIFTAIFQSAGSNPTPIKGAGKPSSAASAPGFTNR
jgi:hypothetical protein